MVTVGNFPDLASARVAQSLLEAEGIESSIPDEYFSGVDWQMNTALQGVRINVAPQDEENAREILAQSITEPSPDPLAEEESCPSCRSGQFGPPNWKKRIKVLAILFFPVLLLYPLFLLFSRENECYACGHRWG